MHFLIRLRNQERFTGHPNESRGVHQDWYPVEYKKKSNVNGRFYFHVGEQ